MKKLIFDYISKNNNVCVNDISNALNINPNQVLRIVKELQEDSYIKIQPVIPLSIDNDNSTYYTVTGKKYLEN